MGLFNKLFSKKQAEPNDNIWPTRPMKFKYELKPRYASNLATQFREAVLKIDGHALDYSVESIQYVDNFLQEFRDKKIPINDFAETVFMAGCYVGQVIVYHASGQWIGKESIPEDSRNLFPVMVIKFPKVILPTL